MAKLFFTTMVYLICWVISGKALLYPNIPGTIPTKLNATTADARHWRATNFYLSNRNVHYQQPGCTLNERPVLTGSIQAAGSVVANAEASPAAEGAKLKTETSPGRVDSFDAHPGHIILGLINIDISD